MVQLDRDERNTVAQKICGSLKRQIMGGAYARGASLPSTRALAAELGVSRTTVTAAYEQLLAEGFIEIRQGATALVAPTLELGVPKMRRRPKRLRPPVLSGYGRRVSDLPPSDPAPPRKMIADFRYGDLAGTDFPTLAWKRALNAALPRHSERLRYDDPRGSLKLRSALQAYLWRARSLQCDADQIVVVNGSQQGLDLCTRLLLDAGNRVVIEDPCYVSARETLLAAGAATVPIEVASDGLRTDQLATIKDARLCYVTPSHQFPLGAVMSVGRRQELLAWVGRTGAYVIEDDYDSEYRFDIKPIPPLHGLDEAGRVIYLGTVSKTLSPRLRLGYMVVPLPLREVFAKAKQIVDRHTPTLEQEALADFIASGAYERHVRRVRRRNAERRAVLLKALSTKLGRQIVVSGADAGLHVVVWFRQVPRRLERRLIEAGQAAGLGLYPITPLYSSSTVAYRPAWAGLVMGYAGLDEVRIERGVDRLAIVLDAVTAPAAG
jgi:GntR family transcriptional regulator/MocR family aminotransferase